MDLSQRAFSHFAITFCYRPQVSSALFFQYNTQLGPPYHILIDTNFINFSVKYKLDIIQNMMDCLYAKCKFTLSLRDIIPFTPQYFIWTN